MRQDGGCTDSLLTLFFSKNQGILRPGRNTEKGIFGIPCELSIWGKIGRNEDSLILLLIHTCFRTMLLEVSGEASFSMRVSDCLSAGAGNNLNLSPSIFILQ